MTRKERFDYILNYFRQKQGPVTTELDFGSAFQLIVATLLSAQCTDKRINMITPELFRHYPTAEAMAKANWEDIFELIKSVSYPNAKAHHLSEMSKILVERFNGRVPDNTEEVTQLPGVGRKTANVVLNTAFGHPTIAVDTHIFRVCNRTNFAPGKDVVKVEEKLLKVVPKEFKVDVHHWLILHGRYTCTARKPRCGACIIEDLCEYKEKTEY